VALSANSYCGDVPARINKDPNCAGFLYTTRFHNDQYDVEGFMGWMLNIKTIFVVFRGSNSIVNWLDGTNKIITDYTVVLHFDTI
jgi:hypothetical protein